MLLGLFTSHRFVVRDILIHDWWAGVLAAAFGKVSLLSEATILYRQHGSNELGAIRTKSPKYVVKSLKTRGRKSSASRVGLTYRQAGALLKVLEAEHAPQQTINCVKRYISIPKSCKPKRIYTILRYGYRKQNPVSLIGQLVFC